MNSNGWRSLMFNICFYKNTMLNLHAPYRQGNLTRDQMNHSKTMSDARDTVQWLFDERKTYYFYFKSKLNICLSSLGKIYLECGISENTKTCLIGNKLVECFNVNPINVCIVLLYRYEELENI